MHLNNSSTLTINNYCTNIKIIKIFSTNLDFQTDRCGLIKLNRPSMATQIHMNIPKSNCPILLLRFGPIDHRHLCSFLLIFFTKFTSHRYRLYSNTHLAVGGRLNSYAMLITTCGREFRSIQHIHFPETHLLDARRISANHDLRAAQTTANEREYRYLHSLDYHI